MRHRKFFKLSKVQRSNISLHTLNFNFRLEEILLELLKEQQILKDKSIELREKLDSQVEKSNDLQDKLEHEVEKSHELQNRLDHEVEHLKGDIEGVRESLQGEIQGEMGKIQIRWLMDIPNVLLCP